ncbi:carbohydrate ABC transporter permease [Modestobacter roseus]|uniref:Multiple sugar transport system permease protein n=1 Tax=Modestobacter roseus TaxID=1181884 RepID=A0A562IRE0_9ACTN|nr:carbohydrate ABC transporter permease [Modestobacter roseus]MQA33145.1 ABC transporter permease subunit [Modestobacter roseus]TWH73305.1 multiple sugar transport system permease protein [Modestobacter roseus]
MTRTRWSWKAALGLLFTAVMLFPVYWMVNVSLTRTSDLRRDPPHWFPWNPTLDGYANVLQEQLPALATSLVVGFGCVVLTLLIAAPAGYALALLRLRGAGTLNFLLLVAQMIPAVVMGMGFYAIYVRLGALNTLGGLIVADTTIAVPFAVLLFTAFMSGIPKELLQAATMDGAGTWRTFWSIVLPVSRNSVLTVSLFAFLWAWSDFIFASTLNRNGDHVPITLGIYRYIGNNTTEWNSIMATAVVASIPAALLLVVAQRYVAAGVTAGAVKD